MLVGVAKEPRPALSCANTGTAGFAIQETDTEARVLKHLDVRTKYAASVASFEL